MKYKAYRVIDDDETIERVEVHGAGFDLSASITTSGLNTHTSGHWIKPYDDDILLDAIIARIKLRAQERKMLPPSFTRCLEIQQDEDAKRYYVAQLQACDQPKADYPSCSEPDFSHETVTSVPHLARDFEHDEVEEARDSSVEDPVNSPERAEHPLLEDMPTYLDTVIWLDDAETQGPSVSANTFITAVLEFSSPEPTTFLDIITDAHPKLILPERSGVDSGVSRPDEARHRVDETRRERQSSAQSSVDANESRPLSSRGEREYAAGSSGADDARPAVTIIDLRGTVRPTTTELTTQPKKRMVEHLALVMGGVALIVIGAVAYFMSTRSGAEASLSSVVPIIISHTQNSTAT